MTISESCPPAGSRCVVSWSGGKDSCLAADRAVRAGAHLKGLFSMLHENGEVSRSHGLGVDILQAQADSLRLPLSMASATWEAYETEYIKALRTLRHEGVDGMIFGDLEGAEHRAWEERVCREAEMMCWLPLWDEKRDTVLAEFIHRGFDARIVSLDTKRMPTQFLGRTITMPLAEELRDIGVDPCGENGEYHTLVTGGALFAQPIPVRCAATEMHSGYSLLRYVLTVPSKFERAQ